MNGLQTFTRELMKRHEWFTDLYTEMVSKGLRAISLKKPTSIRVDLTTDNPFYLL